MTSPWLAASCTLAVTAVSLGCASSDQSDAAATRTVTAGVVEVNDISLAYESLGSTEDEAILLIAGLGAQMTMWPDELCEALVGRGFRVVRFDNRDVGLSTHLDSLGSPDWQGIGEAASAGKPVPLPYTLADMATDSIALLNALGIEKAHIAGASMGGGIAQLLAIHHPERVISLTSIFADTGNPEMPGPDAEMLQAIPPAPPRGSAIEDIVEREIAVWQAIGSPGYPTDEQTMRERIRRDVERNYNPMGIERQVAAVMFAGDRREVLRRLAVPTVVLHGDADRLVPVENGRDTARTIPDAELRVIEGLGHDIPLALVDVFADAIMAAASRSRPL